MRPVMTDLPPEVHDSGLSIRWAVQNIISTAGLGDFGYASWQRTKATSMNCVLHHRDAALLLEKLAALLHLKQDM